jgi:hypothetical protein
MKTSKQNKVRDHITKPRVNYMVTVRLKDTQYFACVVALHANGKQSKPVPRNGKYIAKGELVYRDTYHLARSDACYLSAHADVGLDINVSKSATWAEQHGDYHV